MLTCSTLYFLFLFLSPFPSPSLPFLPFPSSLFLSPSILPPFISSYPFYSSLSLLSSVSLSLPLSFSFFSLSLISPIISSYPFYSPLFPLLLLSLLSPSPGVCPLWWGSVSGPPSFCLAAVSLQRAWPPCHSVVDHRGHGVLQWPEENSRCLEKYYRVSEHTSEVGVVIECYLATAWLLMQYCLLSRCSNTLVILD